MWVCVGLFFVCVCVCVGVGALKSSFHITVKGLGGELALVKITLSSNWGQVKTAFSYYQV